MNKCNECGVNYPDNCCSIMFSTKGNTYCCGICALEIRNNIHGLKDKKFQGEMANVVLNNCKKYLLKKGIKC